ncbi:MAG TPA: DUF998 domain-containing protein [Saprospiraceae bacterium]|nr:DUF998 domain-containing protein [Saprospiraceae bacterium]HMQ81572.1 DUF998 domain-containing protein [Saprospiraceae bacterium]
MIRFKKAIIYFSICSAVSFFMFSSLAMLAYPGGTIHDRRMEGYSLTDNYFSDLGRTRSWNGEDNYWSNQLFQTSLVVVGVSLILFFLMLPSLFQQSEAQNLATFAAFFGCLAGLSYIGIALNPLDVDYTTHTLFVRGGFIAFLLMCFCFALAIKQDPTYPNRYAQAIVVFSVILAVQIVIMLFGPRSWHSPEALFLQATAQKIVVYSEICCMLYQMFGALGQFKRLSAE